MAKVILVVEDDEPNRQLIIEFITRRFADVEVIEAGDMVIGLYLSEVKKPALIILDLNLPDSLGLRTLEEFVKRHPAIPIIVITGDEPLAHESVKAGALDYVSKPFTEKEICDRVSVALAKEKTEPVYEPIKKAITQMKIAVGDSVNVQPK